MTTYAFHFPLADVHSPRSCIFSAANRAIACCSSHFGQVNKNSEGGEGASCYFYSHLVFHKVPCLNSSYISLTPLGWHLYLQNYILEFISFPHYQFSSPGTPIISSHPIQSQHSCSLIFHSCQDLAGSHLGIQLLTQL